VDQFLAKLAEHGVLVVAFAIAIQVLWKTNRDMRTFYEGDPKDHEKRPGKIAEERAAATVREDDLRTQAKAQLDEERAEQKILFERLLAALEAGKPPTTD